MKKAENGSLPPLFFGSMFPIIRILACSWDVPGKTVRRAPVSSIIVFRQGRIRSVLEDDVESGSPVCP